MAEGINERFRSVLTVEREFEPVEEVFKGISMNTVSVTTEEILKMLKELDVNKSMGPDGVSNWILKECSEQLAGKIHSVVVTSLMQGRVPKDWKRANITRIFK